MPQLRAKDGPPRPQSGRVSQERFQRRGRIVEPARGTRMPQATDMIRQVAVGRNVPLTLDRETKARIRTWISDRTRAYYGNRFLPEQGATAAAMTRAVDAAFTDFVEQNVDLSTVNPNG